MVDLSWIGRARSASPSGRAGVKQSVLRRRRLVAIVAAVSVAALGTFVWTRGEPPVSPAVEDPRGTPAWALAEYGNPDAPKFRERKIVEMEFLGTTLFVHRAAKRHFLRLEQLFLARAPEYAATVALGEPDDWSYSNRAVRGGSAKSSHAFGIAIDINALQNVLGTVGNMPPEVVAQWEMEGGGWGGRWSRPDPMHFETHLTPEEIRSRYRPDGTPRDWYLQELIGG